MREFFRAWRRKVGLATLVMATLLTIEWFRSLVTMDRIMWMSTGSMSSVTLNDGVLFWLRVSPISGAKGFVWRSGKSPTPAIDPWRGYKPEWQRVISGFQCGVGESQTDANVRLHLWAIPFWSIVLPLTFFSAYLILVPSRKRPSNASQIHA